MKLRLKTKILGMAVMLGMSLFQPGGCVTFSNDDFRVAINTGAQNFFNSIWGQWATVKFNGLLHVE